MAAGGYKNSFLKRDRGIILAADVATISDLRRLVELAASVPEVVGVKIGFSLALRYSLPLIVKAINEVSQLAIIYDHQKAATDIPEMGKLFADVCCDAGVQGVIFFPLAGPRTLKGFVAAAFDRGLVPIVGLVMSHPAYLQSEGGFITDDAPDSICKIALDMGVTSFVLPGTRTDIVARFAAGPLMSVVPATVLMPGIGSQGGSITSAFEAAKPHRRFAIVGSAIYNAADPKAALTVFVTEIES